MTVTELVRAERSYFGTMNRSSIDVQRAISLNSAYYEKLFNLYENTGDIEERLELGQELVQLNQQLRTLSHIKLLQGGTA